jgi:uncharacterized RDD family membrane protein YckC
MNTITAPAKTRIWRRLAAACYDLLLVFALLMVLTALVIAARRGAGVAPGSAWFQILLACAWWLYFAWSWTHGGQTVGMRAWHLVLIDRTGENVSWGQAGIRFAVALLSTLAFGLGFLWALVDREGQTWHDRAAGTRLKYRPVSLQPYQGQGGHDQ